MSSILYNIIISPIELVVEIVFELMFRIVGRHETNQGLAVIGVSLAISLLTLPLYRRADAVQQKERDIQAKLSHWVKHIRKTFKGDERFMMLQTYYRQNNYNPLYALNGSISLLLEIPFFIAAYHFLSHLEALNGASFGLILDLGKPDSLIKFGDISLNLLPILMTAINCISSAVYLKGFPLKDKIQTYGMALIFLVLLYNSPSGLVVYWTCNNIFSLGKNIFYKIRNPKKYIVILCALFGVLLTFALILSGVLNSRKKLFVVFLFQYVAILPLFFYLARNTVSAKKFHALFISKISVDAKWSSSFFFASVFLVILTGILIPSSVIASSPAEFVDLRHYKNPLYFLVNSICYAIGFFMLWPGIVRQILSEQNRKFVDLILWLFCGIFLVNYMCFGRNMGVLSPLLVYEDGVSFSRKLKLLNLFVCTGVFLLFFFAFRFKKFLSFSSIVLVISISVLALTNVHKTQKKLSAMAYIKSSSDDAEIKPIFTLSRNGKNVIVFMLDRAISGYVPYMFDEKPELKRQFAGFTYYPNTLSHGFFTNFGTPALFGGYEYTVTEMNRRKNELLADKQNEALKVLPKLFSDNGYNVEVLDPPYAGYNWIGDLSIYDDIPNVKAYNLAGKIKTDSLVEQAGRLGFDRNKRNFFCYSIFRCLPLAVSKIFYSNGNYYDSKTNPYKNTELSMTFLNQYCVLESLPLLTKIDEKASDNFLNIQNSATHEPFQLFQLPDYELTEYVDNSNFKTAAEGKIALKNDEQLLHYHANIASFLALGKWFDFMRKNGVYDNTRIILVADHGRGLAQFENLLMKNPEIDVEWCNPLLMVKDFNSTEFKTSNEFMTNADVPTLAVKDVIENPRNPFTGKTIDNKEKNAHPQLVTSSLHWEITKYNGTAFDTSDGHWYSVHDDIFKEENWKLEE
ncbi:MAG: YidC/Oxa1 family membrane protein insertase [Treponema sp.]|nr:YidC/Oxa1 family membrane protein insertase [Treponema sp.]